MNTMSDVNVQDTRIWGWGGWRPWGFGWRPWGFFGGPFFGGFLGGLLGSALVTPFYGGYPFYGYGYGFPYGGIWW
jgi:hypothetical protein